VQQKRTHYGFAVRPLGGLSQNATLAPVPQPTRTQPPHYLENKKVTQVLGEYLRYFWSALVPRSRSGLALTGAVPLLRLDAPKGGTQEIDRPGVPPFVLASLAGSPPPPVKALRLRFRPHWLGTASGGILEIELAHNHPLCVARAPRRRRQTRPPLRRPPTSPLPTPEREGCAA